MWRLVHQWSFLLFDCFWRLVHLLHCWYSLGRPVTIGTQMLIFAVLTVFDDWYTVGLYQQCINRACDDWYTNGHFCCWCTNRHMSTKTIQTVYQQCTKNSQKTVKTAKLTIGVPIVTGLPRQYQQCSNRQKQSNSKKWPLVHQSSHVYTESVE